MNGITCCRCLKGGSGKAHSKCTQTGATKCSGKKTLPQAIAFCAAQSPPMRLCTSAEIKAKICDGTGCDYDSKEVWVRAMESPHTGPVTA